jgi:hypothetical protein
MSIIEVKCEYSSECFLFYFENGWFERRWNQVGAFEVSREEFHHVIDGGGIDGFVLGRFPFEVDDEGQDSVVDLVLDLSYGKDGIAELCQKVVSNEVADLVEIDGFNPCCCLG